MFEKMSQFFSNILGFGVCVHTVYIYVILAVEENTCRWFWANIKQTQNICIAFVQCWTNVEDVWPTLYECFTNGLCLLGILKIIYKRYNFMSVKQV